MLFQYAAALPAIARILKVASAAAMTIWLTCAVLPSPARAIAPSEWTTCQTDSDCVVVGIGCSYGAANQTCDILLALKGEASS